MTTVNTVKNILKKRLLGTALLTCCLSAVLAQDDKKNTESTENDYYKMITLPIPEGVALEVGGLAALPNGNLAVSTRRGEVWIIENPYGPNPYYRKFAAGLHEILGLAYRDGVFYMAQRGELTKLIDKDGDGKADVYETVYAWPLSGHYHEYSFGPIVMPDGGMFVTGNVAFGDVEWWRGESRVPWRGWTMYITPDGKMTPYATGMRSPCGIGMINGEFFYADNQGDWMGAGGLVKLEKGDFAGHPAGLRWAGLPESPVKVRTADIYSRIDPRMAKPGEKPVKPENDPKDPGKTLFEVAKEVKGIRLPAVWLPHGILGISTSAIVQIPDNNRFGPFAGQVLIGDQGQSKISRVFLEKVKNEYQGAAFPFREGFQSGVLRMAWGEDGSLFVGQTNRGWGSTGADPYGLQRLVWTQQMPFEMKAVRAMPDGFEIEFTQPVDKKSASNPDNYAITSFTYKYHPVYGSPTIRNKEHLVQAAIVSEDGLKVRLVADSLREKYIHEIKVEGVVSVADKENLLHPVAYYTLNNIPEGPRLNVPRSRPKNNPHANHQMIMINPDASVKDNPDAKKPSDRKSATPLQKNQTTLPADWKKADVSFTIGTKPGLKYDQTELRVKAGAKVELIFSNNDDMPHNLVVVLPGQNKAVGELGMKLGLKGAAMNYVPLTSKVLAHTKLLAPGTSEKIYFQAPDTPGDYMYVCTVPGHFYVMYGILKVVK